MGLNQIVGVQKLKRHPAKLLGLLQLFETSSITSSSALALNPAPSSGIIGLNYEYTSAALPGSVSPNALEFGTREEPVHFEGVPQQWIVAIRLALVSFMATAWFLSRSYTTTMYLILGLATATIALQQGDRKPSDRGHWILYTVTAEVLIIILIYGLVRLRH